MVKRFAAAAMLAMAAPAGAMDVATFLGKAEALQARGPLALFSSDVGALKAEAENAGKSLKAERLARVAARQAPEYCPPSPGSMNSDELLGAMRAIPAAQRPHVSVRAAMKALMIRKFPCPS